MADTRKSPSCWDKMKMRPQPFTTIFVGFTLIVVFMSIAQFVGLPYWRPDISTELGLIEFLLLSLTGIGLVSLAKRERQQRRPLSSIVGTK